MTETKIVLTVTHKKPLPEGATDIVAARFYGWAHSQNCQVNVAAEITSQKPVEEADAAL